MKRIERAMLWHWAHFCFFECARRLEGEARPAFWDGWERGREVPFCISHGDGLPLGAIDGIRLHVGIELGRHDVANREGCIERSAGPGKSGGNASGVEGDIHSECVDQVDFALLHGGEVGRGVFEAEPRPGALDDRALLGTASVRGATASASRPAGRAAAHACASASVFAAATTSAGISGVTAVSTCGERRDESDKGKMCLQVVCEFCEGDLHSEEQALWAAESQSLKNFTKRAYALLAQWV